MKTNKVITLITALFWSCTQGWCEVAPYVQETIVALDTTVAECFSQDEAAFKVFEMTVDEGVPYRIPAIACNRHNEVVCISDYRYSHADIGVVADGMIDLRYRIRDDKGRWSQMMTLASSREHSGDTKIMAFGDPCVVADRESDRMMVVCCYGNVGFFGSENGNRMACARFYSEDGGHTWTYDGDDITQQIFEQLSHRSDGPIRAFFIGSGKITQSRKVKIGQYYRLYCGIVCRLADNSLANFVIYSDNFGKEWNILGDIDKAPVPQGADEPKAEELPDGSVLLSTRCNGGRIFNVYHFTDLTSADGCWGQMAVSNSSNNGVVAEANSCNGEIMVVPVVRNSDEKVVHLLLQSLPFGPDRRNVGIYYKPLQADADWTEGAVIASNWDGRWQISTISSAYSTFCIDKNGHIHFFYEENGHNDGYDMVYKCLTIDKITEGKYRAL